MSHASGPGTNPMIHEGAEMFDHTLTGLDGANPLALLAALGALLAVGEPTATLRWVDRGRWTPVLRCSAPDRDALIAALDADRVAWSGSAALDLHYRDDKGKVVRDLKPSSSALGVFFASLAAAARPGDRADADLAAAWGSELVQAGKNDGTGDSKPTALHFTAGQQRFLEAARELNAGVTPDDLQEALFGPWGYSRTLKVLNWDAADVRDYALRASDPADLKTGVPGAHWLGVRGMSFFPVAAVRRRLVTTGVAGRWKSERMTWPMWTVALYEPVIRSLLTRADLPTLTPDHAAALGIAAVLESRIKRSEQGGYGSFLPASVR